jgi:hypothetical protein
VICGFRYNTGPDYISYNVLFNQISENKLWFVLEPGFSALIIFFDNYGSYRLMLLCIAIFSIIYKLVFFYKESDAPFLSILIYYSSIFLGSDFGQIRQGIAFCFTIMAFQAAYDKRFAHFMMFVLTAAVFHYSAIIIVPFYFLGKMDINEKRFLLLCCSCILCSLVFPFLGDIIVVAMNIPYLIEKFNLYKSGQGFSIGNLILTSVFKLIVIIYYFKEKHILLKKGKRLYFLNLYIWGYAISLLFMYLPALSSRGTLYFEMLELILIPNIITCIKKNERFIYCICIIFYTGLCIYKNIAPYQEIFIPYNLSFNLSK